MGPNAALYKKIKESIAIIMQMNQLNGIFLVDFSILLYKIIQSEESIYQFHQKPAMYIPALKFGILEFDLKMKANGLNYIFILDGQPHPKKLASQHRKNCSIVDQATLDDLMKVGESDPKAILKLMKTCRILSRSDIHENSINIVLMEILFQFVYFK
jgi:hypothetical protein